MSASSSTKPVLAFFGATGGCGAAVLTRALNNGFTCTALARTPDKLRNQLTARGIPTATLDTHLTIIQGSAHDQAACERALTAPNSTRPVDTIISALGGTPRLALSLFQPVVIDDPHICANATRTMLAALRAVISRSSATKKPFFVVISTTGVSKVARDVPYLLGPLYHWLLAQPHVDKREMEDLLVEEKGKGDGSAVGGFVCVRPTLLMDGKGVGVEKVKVGWEGYGSEQKGVGPAIGYTIDREDVGAWIFEELCRSEKAGEWSGRAVSLCA